MMTPDGWDDDNGPGGDTPPRRPPRRTRWTARELMEEVFPETRWAVPRLIPAGFTLIAGSPKVGKSWLAGNLAMAVGSGGKAFGTIDVEAGDVLYLALEDNGRRLQKRLKMMLQGAPAPDRLTLETVSPKMHEGGAELITDWLDAHPDARLVIVDVLKKVRGSAAKGANTYDFDYETGTAFKQIADAYDIALVVLHHTRKGESEDFLDAVSGTQGIAGAADTVAVLTRPRGSTTGVFKLTGRDVDESERALDFDADTGTWKLLDGPAVDYVVSDQRRAILRHLRTHEGDGPKAIAGATKVSYQTVRHLVRRMVDAGELDTDGKGHYFAPVTPITPIHSVHSVHNHNPNCEGCEQCERPAHAEPEMF